MTDQHGHVLSRHEGTRGVANLMDHIDLAPGFVYSEELVGTNAIGTALEARGPSVIVGHEHFMDALTTISCAATPISDPTTGRIIGIVDLSCAAEYTTPLMLPLAKRVAWEIQQRLLGDESVDQHMLREQFLKARRSVRGPLFAISAAGLVVTGAAAALVDPADHDLIWELVGHSLAGGSSGWSHVSLGSGRTVALQCEPVMDGARLVGAMVRVDDGCLTTGSSAIDDPWSTLTATEQAVADQVAQGLTNAEIADHLVLSPHTIDYHLRQLFRKLSLHSRVELTRAVVERRREP